ncbi:tetratricopeptide repeat protein [Hyalangium rubrum]|uniref:Tetratricopeptide repeat protein n=1 Tax=Hyalangium rubrum TaxID=3103134 RepID=A0ABU5H544_9BACT|nr:tetratricopeptide repeat protein [Hyalangium sp. s54d21]MDY7228605.1 tetratricopeptide repeat protein [Hyalangium sp. s54d21]
MAENLECPECHAPIAPDDFQCESCELLLNPHLASGEYVITEPTIVRALLSPPMRTASQEMPAVPARSTVHDAVTVRFAIPIDEGTIPYLSAGLDDALQPLHPFEAYVASFIDGTQTVSALARAARLPEIEIKVVLKSLLERRMVELHRQPVPRPPEEELPLLNGVEFLEEPPAPPPAARPAPPPPRLPIVPPPAPTRPAAPARASTATPPPIVPRIPSTPPPIAKPPPRSSATPPPLQEPANASRSTERTEDFLQRAIRLEREGQVDRAIEVLKRGLARASSPAPLYNKLALILVNQRKDFSQASELLEQAVELEPNNPVFQQNLLKVVALAASAQTGSKGRKGGRSSRFS